MSCPTCQHGHSTGRCPVPGCACEIRVEVHPIPRSVRTGTLTIMGVTLRTSVLDDGRRIIDADDMVRLFERMGEPGAEVTTEDAAAYQAFMRGGQ